MDFLLVLAELFPLVVTAEALRAKIDRKSAFRSNAVISGDWLIFQQIIYGHVSLMPIGEINIIHRG